MKIFGQRFMEWRKDGGKDSTVDSFIIVEIKKYFSIMVLRFSDGTRENYHSHAFHAISWIFSGALTESRAIRHGICHGRIVKTEFSPSLLPLVTTRKNLHRVTSHGVSWALTFRGPWLDYWYELRADGGGIDCLTHGRELIGCSDNMDFPEPGQFLINEL